MDSGKLLREARKKSGLTQAQVAKGANTSQSAVATYEAGGREPSMNVLQRMIEATGHKLVTTFEIDKLIYRLCDLAIDIAQIEANKVNDRLRLVFEFLRSANEENVQTMLLVAVEPISTGDRRFDALIGAVCEDLCTHHELAPPEWVYRDMRFLEGFWWVSDMPSSRVQALINTPASFRRRGVMIERRDLVSI